MRRVLTWMAAVAVAGLGAFYVLGLSPRAEMLPETTITIEAGDPIIDAWDVRPYTARYSTQWRLMGVPLERGTIDVAVAEVDSGLAITFDFGTASDSMLVRRRSLAPMYRNIPNQRMTFDGNAIEVTLGGDPPVARRLEFPGRVFEVSILDMVALSANRDPPFRVAWGNFADTAAWRASVTEHGQETIAVSGGESFETRIIDVGFADGQVRRYWMADRPPYKIKQNTYDSGRAVVYSWDLESYTAP